MQANEVEPIRQLPRLGGQAHQIHNTKCLHRLESASRGLSSRQDSGRQLLTSPWDAALSCQHGASIQAKAIQGLHIGFTMGIIPAEPGQQGATSTWNGPWLRG